ncbi:lauroyl acyltransferase [Marivibrio halodurans]|uniref:Lauroyl acyltransferase n=1 Tax=Marivibrio halodurans TaxID=2039722 RepID=A0A8J7V2K1_9PROT|nr:lauroyl acyltransferase [Marivibrio halodurans]MBP5858901.1 lauroyl acyltransferase [Marivibrio halodurans]
MTSANSAPKMPWRRRFLYHLQSVALHGTLALLRILPFEIASRIGGLVFRTVGPRLSADRVARRNLRAAFPDLTRAEEDRIVREVWDNLGRGAAEYAQITGLDTFDPNRIEIVGEDHLLTARDSGAPFIVFSAHMGNWEMASLAAAQRGCLLTNIYRPASNPGIDRLIRRVRSEFCAELLPKGREGARGALRAMKENRPLGLLIDQKFNEGLPIPFFGRPAYTASAPAELALRFRCRVLPVRLERLPDARFRITIEPPMELPDSGDRNQDIEALLTAMNARVEEWVRARPGQWFWVHRRWPKGG